MGEMIKINRPFHLVWNVFEDISVCYKDLKTDTIVTTEIIRKVSYLGYYCLEFGALQSCCMHWWVQDVIVPQWQEWQTFLKIEPIGAHCLFSLLKRNANYILTAVKGYITYISYSCARSGGINETMETSRTLWKWSTKKMSSQYSLILIGLQQQVIWASLGLTVTRVREVILDMSRKWAFQRFLYFLDQ